VDPVLKRAQFNQKIVNMTQQQEESSRAKMGIKRQVSAETRFDSKFDSLIGKTSRFCGKEIILFRFSKENNKINSTVG
jgi:hypothetical protein